jgi:acyl-CoA reductase-like NAD-dependent aldehyde dehydrogenase
MAELQCAKCQAAHQFKLSLRRALRAARAALANEALSTDERAAILKAIDEALAGQGR